MPKLNRPGSWDGSDVVDVAEAARRLGRSTDAIYAAIKRGKLTRAPSLDSRVFVYVADLERAAMNSRPAKAQ